MAGPRRAAAIGLLALLLGGVAPSPIRAQSSDIPPASLQLSPGDVIRIAVWRKPEYSGDFTIAADGTIRHPLYRNVKVAGVRFETVEDRIRNFLIQYENDPRVSIEPLFRVAVGGAVPDPNLYTLPPETTIAQAVAMAGGPTEQGRVDRVKLIRGGREVLLDLTRSDGSHGRLTVQSGDQIVVGRRGGSVLNTLGPIASFLAVVVGVVTLIDNNSSGN